MLRAMSACSAARYPVFILNEKRSLWIASYPDQTLRRRPHYSARLGCRSAPQRHSGQPRMECPAQQYPILSATYVPGSRRIYLCVRGRNGVRVYERCISPRPMMSEGRIRTAQSDFCPDRDRGVSFQAKRPGDFWPARMAQPCRGDSTIYYIA